MAPKPADQGLVEPLTSTEKQLSHNGVISITMALILMGTAFLVFPWPTALWTVGAILYFGRAVGYIISREI